MAQINSLKQYKLAKQLTKDIEEILKVTNLSQRALERYKHYRPVAAMLFNIKEEESILKAHLEKYKKIKKDKGKILE